MSIKKIFFISCIISLLIPIITQAQIKITEIMYDPEGTDTKREWIELFNSGGTSVDLSTYFFFENNVFHKLVPQGSSILSPGEYAVIVDSVAEVIAEYKNFMGQVFDSTFSLNNTGETISIANATKEIIDTVSYTSEVGASNDGNSIQINGEDKIIALPTFGEINSTENQISVESPVSGTTTSITENSSDISTHTQQESLSTYTQSSGFKVGAGRDRMISIYTPIDFQVQISKSDMSPKFLWNFGDFTTVQGKKVKHIYEYEGVYEVVVEGRSKDVQSISRTQVVVVEPRLTVKQATSTLSIQNNSKNEINLGGFMLRFNTGDSYQIPRNTIIAGGAQIHKTIMPDLHILELVYPNGEIYQRFDTI